MTLIVGMNLGEYVMLAADTRVSYYPPNRPMWFKDDTVKIRRTSMGLITGMGLVPLLDRVKERLAREDPYFTNRIVEIVKEERQAVSPRLFMDPRVRTSVERETCWMFSYMHAPDPKNITPGSARLRLAICHPDNEYELGLYQPGTAGIGFPSGISEEQAADCNDFLNSQITTLEAISDLQRNIIANIALAAGMIKAIAAVNETVSQSFQIGVHSLGALIGISNVCEEVSDLKLSLGLISGSEDGA